MGATIETAIEIWNAVAAGLHSGDPLVYAGASALAALLAYALVRRLMRVGWLRVVMRIGFFGGVVALVGLAGYALSYYRWDYWLPLGGQVLADTFSAPAAWVLAAAVLAMGMALRKPVAPRHGIRISTAPAPVLETAPPDEPTMDEPIMDEPLASEPAPPTNVVQGPWRKAA